MPVIGARFYSQLDAAQGRCDMLETELSKVSPHNRYLCGAGSYYISEVIPVYLSDADLVFVYCQNSYNCYWLNWILGCERKIQNTVAFEACVERSEVLYFAILPNNPVDELFVVW